MRPTGHHDSRRFLRTYADDMADAMNMMNWGSSGGIEVLHRSLRGDVRRRRKLHLREAVYGRGGTCQGS